MADRIQNRRDTKARWEQYNPVLLEGEIGIVTDDPNLYKVGNGVTAWNSLPYRGFNGTITSEVTNEENTVPSNKAVNDKINGTITSEVTNEENTVPSNKAVREELKNFNYLLYYKDIFLTHKDDVATIEELSTKYPNAIKNWAAYVIDENKIYAFNGSKWEDTGLNNFTRNTIYNGVSPVIQETIGKNLLNPNDFLYGYRYDVEHGIVEHKNGILSNKLYLSPGSYIQRGISPYENKTHTNLILFNCRDEVVGYVTANNGVKFDYLCNSKFNDVVYCRLSLQYNNSIPLNDEIQLERGDTATAYEKPIIRIYDNPAYGKNKLAFIIGASITIDANGWFQNACRKAGFKGINTSISGSNIMQYADKMFKGTLYTEEELENIDVFIISHTHNYDVLTPDLLKDTVKDYERGLNPVTDEIVLTTGGSAQGTSINVAARYAMAFDYVIKKYMDDCYKLRLKKGSKYYGTKCGKKPKIIICSYWQDSYKVFNESSKLLAKKFNITYCDFASNSGFSYKQTNPNDPNSIRISALYCNNSAYGSTNDTHDIPIDGVLYTNIGWHPTRDVNSKLSVQMGNILAVHLLGAGSSKVIDEEGIINRLDEISSEINPIEDYINLIIDKNGSIVGGIKEDGSVVFDRGGFAGERIYHSELGDSLKVITDEKNNILFSIDQEGVMIPKLKSQYLKKELKIAEFISKTAMAEIRGINPMSVLTDKGKWSKNGDENFKPLPAMFCIHDDDTIDKFISSSKPNSWMIGGGYQSLLYPLLQSIGGLRACLAMEGQRCGFTEEEPTLNDNGKIAKKLQDKFGWEIMAHSMTARYQNNNYLVESLDSELANTILANSKYSGVNSNETTSVYVSSENKNYMVNSEKHWVEVPKEYIKPFIQDYSKKVVIMYNPTFPIDYQWGEWVRIAYRLGINGKTWVTPGGTSCHANVPLINQYFKGGFGNVNISQVNVPPLTSTVVRLPMEMQDNYIGEQDTDNSYKPELLAKWKKIVDEAVEKGGWIIFALHAYRPCWLNKVAGALVSEGGTYPDEWVYPLRDITEHPNDYLEPPTEKGINKWSDWKPCPNTRLYMLYEILMYAKERGLINVTSSEGFQKMGNLVNAGFFTKGGELGFDLSSLEGGNKLGNYPHFVIGIDNSQSYFNN